MVGVPTEGNTIGEVVRSGLESTRLVQELLFSIWLVTKLYWELVVMECLGRACVLSNKAMGGLSTLPLRESSL